MSEHDYNRYVNVLEFIKQWRHFETKHITMKMDEFRKQMQAFHYINFDCFDPKYDQAVNILLFNENNVYVQNNADMKKLLSKIIKEGKKQRIMLITKEPLSIYHKKSIAKEKNVTIDSFRHEIFDLIIPKSNASSPHRILSGEEISEITNHVLFCNVVNLPKILDTDPQCIWIGARPGDVLEVIMNSDISGNCVRYLLVMPHTHRFTEKNISKELLKNAMTNMAKYKKNSKDTTKDATKGMTKSLANPHEQKLENLIAKKENPRGLLVEDKSQYVDDDSDAVIDDLDQDPDETKSDSFDELADSEVSDNSSENDFKPAKKTNDQSDLSDSASNADNVSNADDAEDAISNLEEDLDDELAESDFEENSGDDTDNIKVKSKKK